jgi:hypothetical protein
MAHTYTCVDYWPSICTLVDGYTSASTMFSSFTSICAICASTKCYSTTSSSSYSSMNTKSIDVAFGPICSLAHQCFILVHKNSTLDVPIISMSWIITYTNNIFSLYAFPFAHSKDDDECNGNLIANGWIFNTPSFCSSQFLFYFYSSQQFRFLLLPMFVLIAMCFFFPYYFLQFFNRTFYTNVTMNFRFLKTLTTSSNKCKLPSTITLFFHPWTSHSSHSFFYMHVVKQLSIPLLPNLWSDYIWRYICY